MKNANSITTIGNNQSTKQAAIPMIDQCTKQSASTNYLMFSDQGFKFSGEVKSIITIPNFLDWKIRNGTELIKKI